MVNKNDNINLLRLRSMSWELLEELDKQSLLFLHLNST